jgi:non-specific serine/threonine protein kinase
MARRLSPPPAGILEDLYRGAPPMVGGEYLSPETLLDIWNDLLAWTAANLGPDLGKFLAKRAPAWRRVGRVTFHLAENKSDNRRPFAFMATFVTSLAADGRARHLPLDRAIKLYSAEKDLSSLTTLLTPVQVASEKLEWVERLLTSKAIFSPLTFTIKKAYELLSDIPILEECGLTVQVPNWWRRKPNVRVQVVIGSNQSSIFGLNGVLDWDVSLAVGDALLSPEEIAELLSNPDEKLVLFKGQWLEVDHDKLSEALAHWREARENEKLSGLSFINAMRLLAGVPLNDKEKVKIPETGPWVSPIAGEALATILAELKDPKTEMEPKELKATLRPYQRKGLGWLSFLTGLGLGACLADDMGLGKTMQVLALLLADKVRRPDLGASLLVAPASLLANWRKEAAKFAPSLKVAIWHPSETSKDQLARWEKNPQDLTANYDLVIASYALAARKATFFTSHKWRLAIIDEAQAIKNPGSAQSLAVRKLKAHGRLALTGTPIENRLTDLWSIFDFINPGLLGTLDKFIAVASRLENKLTEGARDLSFAPLKRLVAPYLLRRLKSDRQIISDLPEKIETDLGCFLTTEQVKLYSQVVEDLCKALDNAIKSEMSEFKRKGLVLQSLMRLKQVINHPAQLTGDGDWSPDRSGKFLRLVELCQEMAERQERLLVFTQFREIITPLADHLSKVFGREGLIFHGGTKVGQRQDIVSTFQDPNGPPFLILSLKAGGSGLNLTAAGQVIHFDRWWNPAVEDQATDRAYRIGQDKTVIVHKCVTRGTLEEKIDELLASKRELAEEVLGGGQERDLTKLSDEALIKVVSLDLERAKL